MRLKIVIASVAASIIFALSACSNGKSPKAITRARLDSFPDPVRPVIEAMAKNDTVSYTHLRAHET